MIYWVKADFIDALKHTNFDPYLKTKLKNQTGKVGESFSYTIHDSTFVDDDGNSTLTYYVTSRLPEGLNFDPDTRTFSGTPTESGTFIVNVMAIDASESSVSTTFTLRINNASVTVQEVLEPGILVYPNPAKDRIYLAFGTGIYTHSTISITDVIGKEIYSGAVDTTSTAIINLNGNPKGVYFLRLNIDGVIINKKILLE